ncbi:Bax inhibitor-1/YccA family protein [Mucilaginibacter daejeonensis]|uniref:Bax inhibitor-1/YccA family protein n=1 Tax=Mucilaginibacter daejeonensis TaxID=398049 RepID=UPI001D170726|nr:Bax inhibitor-1/YccA family protein [Mucilaginibacter daejeonensis]UEG53620.1 Bax inhibitor-1/YccA family protein [Mucilaginibacter daejeonensis]
MEDNKFDHQYSNIIQLEEAGSSRTFISNVFMWMFVALGISGVFAYLFATNAELLGMIVNLTTGKLTGFGTVTIFAPLAFVLVMNFGLNRISYPVLVVLFLAYASLMGISLSFILLAYTSGSVFGVFVTAAAVFALMAIAGYTTNTDLTKFGSLMVMGLIGLVIASVVNMFLVSDELSKIISYVGVAVFVGLTAYKVQMLKRIGTGVEMGQAEGKKLALMGAMSLYITFINLFLSLLRIFGRRR